MAIELSSLLTPGFQTGKWYGLPPYASESYASNPVYGFTFYVPLWLPSLLVDRVGVLSSFSSPGGKARVALYANAGGKPGQRIHDFGEFVDTNDGSAEIIIEKSVAGFRLPDTWVWSAMTQSEGVFGNAFIETAMLDAYGGGPFRPYELAVGGGWNNGWSNVAGVVAEAYGPLPSTAPDLDFVNEQRWEIPFPLFRCGGA